MADEIKKKVVVEVDLEEDQGDFAKLAQYKTALQNIKTEQKQLEEAYKKERITQKEYNEQLVRLEANQKKIAASYSEVQRGVTGLQSPFDKLNASIKEQANQVNVAGFSLSSFANPVTGTIALLGGLAAAYRNSTVGAKDLDFVQNQLSATTHLLSNAFASLITSGEDGEGFFTSILNKSVSFLAKFDTGATGFLARFVNPYLKAGKQLALDLEVLEDKEREFIDLKSQSDVLLEKNADLQTQINDLGDQYNKKLSLTKEIGDNITLARNQVEANLREQISIIEDQLSKDKENEDLQTKLLQTKRELTQESRKYNKLEEQNERLANGIVAAKQKELQVRQDLLAKFKDTSADLGIDTTKADENLAKDIERIEKKNEAEVKAWESTMQILEDEKEMTDNVTVAQKKNFEGLSFISNALGGVASVLNKNFKLSKAFASAQAAINSFLAGTYVLAENSPFKGPGARIAGMISVIAAGLAQQIKILKTDIGNSGTAGGGGGSSTSTGSIRSFSGSGINFNPLNGTATRAPGIGAASLFGEDAGPIGTVAGTASGGGNISQLINDLQSSFKAQQTVLVIEDVENKLNERNQIKKRANVAG